MLRAFDNEPDCAKLRKGNLLRRPLQRQLNKVQAADKSGNDGADKLAVEAALQQSAPADLIQYAMRRKAEAVATHRMIVNNHDNEYEVRYRTIFGYLDQ